MNTGQNDSNRQRADYMTTFALHRTVLTSDTASAAGAATVAATAFLNFTDSVSARRNRAELYLKKLTGTGTLTIDVYALLPGTVNVWYKVTSQATAADATLYSFSNLPCYQICFVVTLGATSTWELHASYSDRNGHP